MKAAVIGSANLEHNGGGERNALQAARILSELGYEVSIFGGGSEFDRVVQSDFGKGIRYVRSAFRSDIVSTGLVMKLSRGFSLGLIGFHTGKRFWNELMDFDLYYFTFPGMLFRSIGLRLLSAGKQESIILANHGTYYEILKSRDSVVSSTLSKLLDSYILKPFSRAGITIQAQNQYQLDHFVRLGFDPSRIKLIPQCDIICPPAAFVERVENFKVAFLGRLTGNKGVKILSSIIKSMPEVGFEIIGDGPLRNDLNSTFGNRENVRIHGYVAETEKNQILSECDVMLNCSRFESLSVSTVEGMFEGLVTVASKTSSGHRYLRTLVPDGIILTERDPESYVRRIRELMNMKKSSATKFMALRREISRTSLQAFSQDKIINAIRDLFSSRIPQKVLPSEIYTSELKYEL